jgi:hypothetical protein
VHQVGIMSSGAGGELDHSADDDQRGTGNLEQPVGAATVLGRGAALNCAPVVVEHQSAASMRRRA